MTNLTTRPYRETVNLLLDIRDEIHAQSAAQPDRVQAQVIDEAANGVDLVLQVALSLTGVVEAAEVAMEKLGTNTDALLDAINDGETSWSQPSALRANEANSWMTGFIRAAEAAGLHSVFGWYFVALKTDPSEWVVSVCQCGKFELGSEAQAQEVAALGRCPHCS